MTNFSTISDTLAAQRAHLFSKCLPKSMAVFGTVSRSNNGPESDVDIMVKFSQPVGIKFIDLTCEVE